MNIPIIMDTLNLSLKGVQTEKVHLERRLNDIRRNRRSVENAFDGANLKLNQVKDLHTKKSETAKVGQHKVAQSQALCNSIESNNKEKRRGLGSISNQMRQAQETRAVDINNFEEDLCRLAKQIKDARSHYEKEENMDVNESNNINEDLCEQNTAFDKKIGDLSSYLSKLEHQCPPDPLSDELEKEMILNILLEEQKALKKYLESLELEISVDSVTRGLHDTVVED